MKPHPYDLNEEHEEAFTFQRPEPIDEKTRAEDDAARTKIPMPPPTREQVNALIANLSASTWPPHIEVVSTLRALQAENDRLRAQASPAWVALSERIPGASDLPVLLWNALTPKTKWCANEQSLLHHLRCSKTYSHWMNAPAPPESDEQRQAREDREAAQRYIDDAPCGIAVSEVRNAFIAGRKSARSAERKTP